jgi:hypothetical protein
MKTPDISLSGDAELIASQAAMQRAALAARQIAIQTHTGIVVMQDGKLVRIPAEMLRREEQREEKA